MLSALIVEDNAEFSAFLKSLLETRFPSAMILQASDADEALHHLSLSQLDIVLVDISLPGGVNGLGLTELIRHNGASPPVVILTNHDLPEYRVAATRLGADRIDHPARPSAAPSRPRPSHRTPQLTALKEIGRASCRERVL